MTPPVLLRPLREADIEALIRLEEDCGVQASPPERYARILAEPGAVFLGAFGEAERMVGSVSGRVVADEFQIENVAVHPEWRRRGIGQLLIRIGIEIAAGLGARVALLEVRASNLPARALYEGRGFYQTGLRRNYYADPLEDAYLLTLDFSSLTNL